MARTRPKEPPRRTVVVVTALNVEHAAVAAGLEGLTAEVHRAGTLFETGRLPDTDGRVVLLTTGPGNPRVATLTERAISAYRPQAVVFVGIAGGLDPALRLGDVVVASQVYGHQGGSEQGGRFLARPRVWLPAHGLEQVARSVSRTEWWRGPAHHNGHAPPQVAFRPIATGEVLLDSRDGWHGRNISRHYNDAAAVDMEAAGVAEATYLNNALPMLVVRGISDLADGRKARADAGGWQAAAAGNAARFALAVLARSWVDEARSRVDVAWPRTGGCPCEPGSGSGAPGGLGRE